MRNDFQPAGRSGSSTLVDVLDRVLDKGLVIAGDIRVSLAEVELLTIRIRLIVCSLDKAQEIGLDWWRYDRHLSPGRVAAQEDEVALLKDKLAQLEAELERTRRPALPARARSKKSSKNP